MLTFILVVTDMNIKGENRLFVHYLCVKQNRKAEIYWKYAGFLNGKHTKCIDCGSNREVSSNLLWGKRNSIKSIEFQLHQMYFAPNVLVNYYWKIHLV